MKFSEKDLFFNSLLLFSEKSMKKLTESKVAVAGIGGVGCIIVEMLVRNGIGSMNLADIDVFEAKNLNRQIFSSLSTLGVHKAVAGANRVKQINSDCNVKVFDKGVTLDNVESFCRGMDVILAQTDTESSKVLLHRVAKKMKIPVVTGSRYSLDESRWLVKAKLWDYKRDRDLPCYDVTNHPELAKIPTGKLTSKTLKEYDQKIKELKMAKFKDFAKNRPDHFPSIKQADLQKRLTEADNYFNRHVCSVIANCGGLLAATLTLKILLGGSEEELTMRLW